MNVYVAREQRGEIVWEREDLMQTYEYYCICSDCERCHPNQVKNCLDARALQEFSVRSNKTIAVFSCARFSRRPTKTSNT